MGVGEGRWGGGERERRGYEDFYKERRQQRLEASERVKKKNNRAQKNNEKKNPAALIYLGFRFEMSTECAKRGSHVSERGAAGPCRVFFFFFPWALAVSAALQ